MSASVTSRESALPPLVRSDQDQLFERLQNLRAILPVFATELADARRQAARLRVENRKLREQLSRLREEPRAVGLTALTAARRQLGSRGDGVARRALEPAETSRP